MPPNLKEVYMYERIEGRDVLDALIPLFEKGWSIDPKTHKVKGSPVMGLDWDAPWIHPLPRPDATCRFNMHLADVAGFVPKFCRNCFKVVIRPRSVAQLITLYELMLTEFVERKLYCKCGIERRNFVYGNYGGYNYNRGLKEGKQSYKIIRELMDVFIGSDVGVILKRGCTEMELRYGPTKQYVVPEWADDFESQIRDVIEIPTGQNPTPKFLADHIIRKWLEFAWDRGDNTCLEFSDGVPIFPNKIDTYHEEA